MPASSSLAPLALILSIILSRLARTVAGVDAAQHVVGAEFEDHEIRLVGQRPVEPRQPARRRVAGRPAIDDLRVDPVGAQPRFELRRKALLGRQAEPGGQAVAERQDLRRPGGRRGRAPQPQTTASSRTGRRIGSLANIVPAPTRRIDVFTPPPVRPDSRSRISAATSRDVSSSRRSSAAMMRGRSPAGRFWLSLNLPSSRLTAISIPTMPRSIEFEIGRRQVAHPPRRGLARLVPRRQPVEHVAQPFRVADRARRAVGVHRGVVPGRHGRTGFVPARRDIGVRPREDRQHLAAAVREIGDLRIGTRDMALQQHAAAAALDQERDLARDQLRYGLRMIGRCGTAAHQQPEIVALDMRDQHLARSFGEIAAADRPIDSLAPLSRNAAPAR